MTYPIVVTSSNCSLLCATKRIILNHCPVDSNGKAAGGTSTGWVMFTKLGMLCVWQIWPSTQNSNLRISPNDNSLRKILPKWPRHTYTSSLILTSYVSIILGFLSIHISEASQKQYHTGHSPNGWNPGSSSKNIDPMVNSGGIKHGGSLSLATWLLTSLDAYGWLAGGFQYVFVHPSYFSDGLKSPTRKGQPPPKKKNETFEWPCCYKEMEWILSNWWYCDWYIVGCEILSGMSIFCL